MKLMRVGVDLAKNVFQVHGVDRKEQPVWRRRLTRRNWLKVLLETVEPSCEIGMESCSGAYHWARQLQDIQAVHRIRSELIGQRTAKANQIRGLVGEYGLWGDLQGLDDRVAELDGEIAAIAREEPTAQRIQQLRGVGPITATALVAAVGDGTQFANGRQMSAALGLTPKQHSSGGKDRLLGISKRGDSYPCAPC